MAPFELIVFDMDGLLLDSERVALEVYEQACSSFGIPVEKELYSQVIGTNAQRAEQILRSGLEPRVDFDAFQAFWLEHYEQRIHQNEIPVKTGARELLETILQHKIPMAVATSTETTRASHKLKNTGLYDFFDVIIGGDQVKNSKPAPDIYLKAANTLLAEPVNCLAVEDSENGVLSATGAGMTVIQVPDLIPPSENLKKRGHLIMDSLEDIVDYYFA